VGFKITKIRKEYWI